MALLGFEVKYFFFPLHSSYEYFTLCIYSESKILGNKGMCLIRKQIMEYSFLEREVFVIVTISIFKTYDNRVFSGWQTFRYSINSVLREPGSNSKRSCDLTETSQIKENLKIVWELLQEMIILTATLAKVKSCTICTGNSE